MSDETSDPRQIAALRLRETVRAHLDGTALTDAMLDKPVQLSADDAMSAVNTVIASLTVDSDLALVNARRCRCKPVPELDCPVHGEPEVMFDGARVDVEDPVVVSRADLVAYLNRGGPDVHAEVLALERLLAAAGIED